MINDYLKCLLDLLFSDPSKCLLSLWSGSPMNIRNMNKFQKITCFLIIFYDLILSSYDRYSLIILRSVLPLYDPYAPRLCIPLLFLFPCIDSQPVCGIEIRLCDLSGWSQMKWHWSFRHHSTKGVELPEQHSQYAVSHHRLELKQDLLYCFFTDLYRNSRNCFAIFHFDPPYSIPKRTSLKLPLK